MNLSDIKSKEDIKDMLMKQQYIASKEIIYTLYNFNRRSCWGRKNRNS